MRQIYYRVVKVLRNGPKMALREEKTLMKTNQSEKNTNGRKPQEVKSVEENLTSANQKLAGNNEKLGQRPLRARDDLTEYERGFIKGLDVASKHVYAHERAKSLGAPIAAEILDLEIPEES